MLRYTERCHILSTNLSIIFIVCFWIQLVFLNCFWVEESRLPRCLFAFQEKTNGPAAFLGVIGPSTS
jgi:hypothetical protein